MQVLLSAAQIRAGVAELAEKVSAVYGAEPLTIVGVMTGSIVLMADLIRELEMPLRVGVVQASSYRGGTSRGQLTVNCDLLLDIAGRDVLLVDDIFDTGHTLAALLAALGELRPRSLRSAVLLRKAGRSEVSLRPDFTAFAIPDAFVVGYGLDYQDHYRNLPYIAALEPADVEGLRLEA